MSIRLYITKGPHIKKIEGSSAHRAFGEVCHNAETIPYINVDTDFPTLRGLRPELKSFVEKVTHRSELPEDGHRMIGEYAWKSATAKLDVKIWTDGQRRLELFIETINVADGAQLYSMIRGGRIHPLISYQTPMVPAPIRNLQQLLWEAWGVIKRDISMWWLRQAGRFGPSSLWN